jgi:hypothetical protein
LETRVYFDFLKYCLGNEVDMREAVVKMNWRQLFAFAKKQTILGVCLDGVERLGDEYPEEIKRNPIKLNLLQAWLAKGIQIRKLNVRGNAVAAKLYAQLREAGLRCCVLKGQGNALMYPNPYARTPGDVDMWVNASREQIIDYAKKHFEIGDDIRYHHLETTLDGILVELHFFPCIMNNPMYNRRLQAWFKRNTDWQYSNVVQLPDGAGEIVVPTAAFNIIYQLSHIYHHFFDEGIGMRQMIDYYYLLMSLPLNNTDTLLNHESDESDECLEKNNKNTAFGSKTSHPDGNTKHKTQNIKQSTLRYLGLYDFAGAVMYVLHEVLGLPEERMIAPMDVKRGKLLLAEIMDGGNFGKHATKYGHFTQQGTTKKYFLKIWRNMHFVRYYPAEALSEPIFRTWHFFWRLFLKAK